MILQFSALTITPWEHPPQSIVKESVTITTGAIPRDTYFILYIMNLKKKRNIFLFLSGIGHKTMILDLDILITGMSKIVWKTISYSCSRPPFIMTLMLSRGRAKYNTTLKKVCNYLISTKNCCHRKMLL